MNRKTRKGLGAILASVGVTTLLGVMSGTGVVRADDVAEQCPPDDPATGDIDESISAECPDGDEATTEALITMKERCIWYVSGVASSITLTADDPATDDDESTAVYDGFQYPLWATLEDYTAWTSGNISGGGADFDDHAACTFFGEQTGIDVTGTWEDVVFDAEAQNIDLAGNEADDTINMGFSADGFDPLTLDINEGVCRTPGAPGSMWTVGPDIVAHAALSGSILDLAATDATAIPSDEDLGNDKCNATMSVTASIPAGQTPLYAGKAYKFTGPTFTTEISIDSAR